MRRLRFSVEAMAEVPGRLHVGGGVDGDLIRLGDRFDSAIPEGRWRAGDLSGGRQMALVVRAIVCYGKSLNQVDPNMSAGLELEPLDASRPSLGDLLIGEEASPPFAEYEILGSSELRLGPI